MNNRTKNRNQADLYSELLNTVKAAVDLAETAGKNATAQNHKQERNSTEMQGAMIDILHRLDTLEAASSPNGCVTNPRSQLDLIDRTK